MNRIAIFSLLFTGFLSLFLGRRQNEIKMRCNEWAYAKAELFCYDLHLRSHLPLLGQIVTPYIVPEHTLYLKSTNCVFVDQYLSKLNCECALKDHIRNLL